MLFALAIGVGCWVFGQEITLDRLVRRESALRQLVHDLPVLSLAIGFLLYVAASLVPGTTGKSIVCGWLFGFWAALLIVNVALTLAAWIAFLAVRYVFYDFIHRRLSSWIRRVDDALRRDGPIYLVTLRLLHAPYSLTNYAVGATAVRARTFWWTTQLGLLPGNIAFVLAGSQLPTLAQLTEQGPWSLVNVPLLVGLSLIALLPVAVRRWQTSGSILFAKRHNRSISRTNNGMMS